MVLGGLTGPGYSQIIYVSTTGSDAANGATPGTAMRTIQYGITNAVGRGWTDIYVSMGVHTPGAGLNTSATGRGVIVTNHNLRILGGWDTAFTSQSSGVSLLDGQSAVTNVLFISNANNLFIDNFSITRGKAGGATPGYLIAYGGGMLLWKVNNGLFTNLSFSNNFATVGGAVCLLDSSLNRLSLNAVSNAAGPSASTLVAGGGIALIQATGFCQSNVISGNLVSNNADYIGSALGGGLYVENSSFNNISARMVSNWAGYGAAIGSFNGGTQNSNTFSGDLIQNSAQAGGAVFWSGDS
ncbi:MAG: hypothetical protein JNM63_12280, partial [Spirochaetia bacterium]|nr:hypothetical protein [Spirochaetia bacterium]